MASRSGLLPSVSPIFQKTRLCRFQQFSACSQGASCPFAHTRTELQPWPDLCRTRICKTLTSTGSCQNPDCTYAHKRKELRKIEVLSGTQRRGDYKARNKGL